MSIQPRVFAIIVVAMGASILLGMLFGELSVPKVKPTVRETTRPNLIDEDGTPVRKHNTQLLVSIASGAHLPSIFMEVQYAYETGITEFIIKTPLPSNDQHQIQLKQTIDGIRDLGDDITITLALDCNPAPVWLAENPDEVSTTESNSGSLPSIGSAEWRANIGVRIQQLLILVDYYVNKNIVVGVILQGLESGRWNQIGTPDESPAQQLAFRNWIMNHYGNIDAVNAAWKTANLDTPEAILLNDALAPVSEFEVFFLPETDQRFIDYNKFLSETTSSLITETAALIRAHTNPQFKIMASYPDVLENLDPSAGNWGFESTHDSSISGTLTYPLAEHRQVGQHGYFASPVFAQRRTLTIDDTYTGIAYSPDDRAIKVPGTFIPTQVYNLMARNAVLSALTGTTWVIADESGVGTFAHKPLWKQIDTLLMIRDGIHDARVADPANLSIVLDESSAHYVRNPELYNAIFESLIETLTHAGIDFDWITLNDLLKSTTTTPHAYIFPNLFRVSEETRDQLHVLLAAQQSTAIWMYAPGYFDDLTDVAQVSALTAIESELRKSTAKTGSKFAFTGTWFEENQEFGIERTIVPSFASIDESADPIARYRDDDEVSTAIKYLDEGWTSIAVFEPTLTTALLRDLFYLLEAPVDVSIVDVNDSLSIYATAENILLYSRENTTVKLEFDTNHDITNALDEKQGWPNTRSIAVDLSAGETALLNVR